MNYIFGIDIGTQGTKTALFDEQGRLAAEAFQQSEILRPRAGAVEEDPEQQLSSVCSTIRECMVTSGLDPADVAGISIDGQMAGIIGIGKDGKNVTPYDSWLDTRCGEYIRKMDDEAGNTIVESAGGPPSYNHGPKILWWKEEHPEIYRKIYSFVQPGGYAAMRLCGLDGDEAFIDTSYLHFSGFADNRNSCWNTGLTDAFGVDSGKLPRIVSPSSEIGGITAEFTGPTGLREGTPVIAGCGDTAASFLATGAVREGICVDVAGTASVFATTTSEMIRDVGTRTLGCGQSAVPGLWHPYAYINGGGMNLEWFRKEIISLGRESGDIEFSELNRMIEKLVSGENDPFFIPHLGGRVCPSQPDLRGAWINLSWDHGAAQLYRAMAEGVALEYGIYFSILRDLDPNFKPKEIRITGGGGKSAVWNQLKADVLQVPVVLLNHEEGAPLGSALLAGYGTGLFADVAETAGEWIRVIHRVEPNPGNRELFVSRREQYAELIEALNKIQRKYKD